MNTKQSEFGKGCGYCLGLVLAHTGDYSRLKKEGVSNPASLWFYAATDHLSEFVIPSNLSEEFKKRAKKFYGYMWSLRLPIGKERKATERDYLWAVKEAKELLRLLDEENGIETIEADFK